MAEIRQINDGEGEMATALWDENARITVDGGPLPARSGLTRFDNCEFLSQPFDDACTAPS